MNVQSYNYMLSNQNTLEILRMSHKRMCLTETSHVEIKTPIDMEKQTPIHMSHMICNILILAMNPFLILNIIDRDT